ncbi:MULTISPECIES: hypothetical protein [Caballeronia]|jgi:hypothetical protein|uniref:Uncharacterized protein n=1 Tax=Caballeronia udeis TaxID=1232866 RepID=A0ABW8MWD7_9BURK|nr:hypothetical protein [Caballeronia sordidicola]
MDEDDCSSDDSIPPFEEAKALSQSIVTIRTAQGKNVPSDFPHGSPEWQATALEFVQDIDRVLVR